MTTGERRAVVTAVQARYPISERYAYRALGFQRSMVRFVPQRPVLDAPLREKLVTFESSYERSA